jgi:hypothetical protein
MWLISSIIGIWDLKLTSRLLFVGLVFCFLRIAMENGRGIYSCKHFEICGRGSKKAKETACTNM